MSGRASLLVPPSWAIMLWLGGWKGLASRLWLAQSLLLLLRKFDAASAALPCRTSGSPTSRGARRLLSNQLLRPPSGQGVVVVFYSGVDWMAVLKSLKSSRIFALNLKMQTLKSARQSRHVATLDGLMGRLFHSNSAPPHLPPPTFMPHDQIDCF